MSQLPASTKHAILLEYTPHSTTHGFAALAARHSTIGGRKTLERWYARWDHTAASLEHKSVAGRPRILTPSEVSRQVRAPIQAANRASTAVHYTDLLPKVQQQQKTGKEVTLRTLQRHGQEQQQLRAKKKTTKKRTVQQLRVSAYRHTMGKHLKWLCHSHTTLLTCVSCSFLNLTVTVSP